MDISRLLTKALDPLAHALVTISYEHHEVHEGKTFFASYKSPDGADVADNGALRFFLVGGARYSHIVFVASAGGDAEINFYESTACSSPGTPLQAHNMNRNGTMTPSLQVLHTPTVSDSGTRLVNELIPGGTGGAQTPGGAARPGTEWILAPGTDYLVEVINRAGSSQPISIAVQWYEKE